MRLNYIECSVKGCHFPADYRHVSGIQQHNCCSRDRVGYLCWCVQCIDVFPPNIVEFDNGIPGQGGAGGVGREESPFHPGHRK